MLTSIKNRIYTSEWVVMDGRAFDGAVFVDCILVYQGGDFTMIRSVIQDCDLIGPWPGLWRHSRSKGAANTAHEPEVELALQRPAPRWKPGLWFWAYAALCIPFAWVIAMAMTT